MQLSFFIRYDQTGLLIGLLLISICLWSCANASDATAAATDQNTATAEQPLADRAAAKALVGKTLEEPIPADFAIPSYITSELPVGMVYDSLAKRYPDFYGFTDTQLLDSIVQHPQRYLQMITENKAIRRYYDPHSKY